MTAKKKPAPKDNITKETDSKKVSTRKPAAKKGPTAKSYTVNKQVPGVFESEDGKTIVFHTVGAEVASDDPGVERALQLWPDHFTAA